MPYGPPLHTVFLQLRRPPFQGRDWTWTPFHACQQLYLTSALLPKIIEIGLEMIWVSYIKYWARVGPKADFWTLADDGKARGPILKKVEVCRDGL